MVRSEDDASWVSRLALLSVRRGMGVPEVCKRTQVRLEFSMRRVKERSSRFEGKPLRGSVENRRLTRQAQVVIDRATMVGSTASGLDDGSR